MNIDEDTDIKSLDEEIDSIRKEIENKYKDSSF
jgi:hypothetical protein